MKRKIITLFALSSLMLTGCSSDKPTEEEVYRQEVMETNMANVPEWTDSQKGMIVESRGEVVINEIGEGEDVKKEYNSFSPGAEMVDYLASLTKEELLELDDVAKLEILINGVIRDEYTVAAHTLYGKEEVAEIKKGFRDGLLDMIEATDEGEDDFTYVDVITMRSMVKDRNVARHHVDEIIENLNRVYIKLIPSSNFGTKVSLRGEVFPIVLLNQLERLYEDAYQFTGITASQSNTKEEKDILNEYYNDSFVEALVESNISREDTFNYSVGGFTKRDDGTWIPAQYNIFARNIVRLAYGIA